MGVSSEPEGVRTPGRGFSSSPPPPLAISPSGQPGACFANEYCSAWQGAAGNVRSISGFRVSEVTVGPLVLLPPLVLLTRLFLGLLGCCMQHVACSRFLPTPRAQDFFSGYCFRGPSAVAPSLPQFAHSLVCDSLLKPAAPLPRLHGVCRSRLFSIGRRCSVASHLHARPALPLPLTYVSFLPVLVGRRPSCLLLSPLFPASASTSAASFLSCRSLPPLPLLPNPPVVHFPGRLLFVSSRCPHGYPSLRPLPPLLSLWTPFCPTGPRLHTHTLGRRRFAMVCAKHATPGYHTIPGRGESGFHSRVGLPLLSRTPRA